MGEKVNRFSKKWLSESSKRQRTGATQKEKERMGDENTFPIASVFYFSTGTGKKTFRDDNTHTQHVHK